MLRDFSDSARDAEIAVIYYAGHGIEVDGTNYLIPVDAKLERDNDVYDEAFSLDRVLLAVEPAKKLRLVILDACRDNPFSKTMRRTVALALDRARPCQGRADQPELADRLFGQGRLDRAGRRRQEQPVHDRAVAASDDARARRAQGVRLRARRRAQDHRQPAGAVRLWFARRRRRAAGAGACGCPRRPPAAPAPNPQAEVRRDYELALQVGNKIRAQRLPRAASRWLLREPCQASARQDRGRGDARRRDRKGKAGRAGAGAACRRGRAEGRAGQGRSRGQSGRAGARSRPKRPSRSRRIRRPRPNASAPRRRRRCRKRVRRRPPADKAENVAAQSDRRAAAGRSSPNRCNRNCAASAA